MIYLGRSTIGLGTRLTGIQFTAVRYGRRLLLLDGARRVRALGPTEGLRYYRQPGQALCEPTAPSE